MKKSGELSMAVALLIGTTIGAGIFGMPYVFAKAGVLIGLLNLLVLGVIILFVNLCIGEVALRTKKRHMLAGYAGKYLGKTGKTLMAISAILGIFGAMIAYLIGEGEALSAIFGGNPLFYSIAFFVLMSAVIWFDLKAVAGSDRIMNYVMFGVIFLVCLFSFQHVNIENLKPFNLSSIFLPYGVVLFAMIGASAIPEMEGELITKKKLLKKAIILGTIVPFFVYLIFSVIVVGVTGLNTTDVATIGLGNAIGKHMILLGNLFAMLAMATSFISLGLAMKWMLRYDYRFSQLKSWALTCFIPLIVFLAGARSFIEVIGITGAVAGGLEGALLILTARAAKKKGERKPEYSIPLNWLWAGVIILLFSAGIIYQFLF